MNNVFTFGCRLNFWESEKINSILKKNRKTNITVFNTCSVTNDAVKNVITNIKKFHLRNPEMKIAVTGCAVETNYKIFSEMKEVSFVIKNSSKLRQESWKKLSIDNKSKTFHEKDETVLKKVNPSNSNIRKFLRIQNGCDHSCTFCIIPKCRGKSVSDKTKKINNTIKAYLKNGIKEIILTGVDLTSWGIDHSDNVFLGDLLKSIFLENSSNFRLRLSSLDAAELDESFFDVLKNEDRLMHHFHFSLQSLNNLILKRMKRRHSIEQVIKLFKKIRNISPNVTFGADIITGFPTESDSMFLETKELLEKLEISHLHIFPYSEREGTPASKMPQVPIDIRRKRAKELRRLGKKIYSQVLEKQIFNKHKVLIESNSGIGKTENNFNVKLKKGFKGTIKEIVPVKIEKGFLIG
ncbi:MAG: tRNA (N(6)-L-threonylcarbamoyladenosine(37)-C(2))-methylthiotransferase MtaB [Pseudomonadota bacterium]|nr:tRNA (N(6)-L-threonylcarbamoyladenosine(37)-C(2))-methylthiotransferase MtaB [Pseudomonadota bacterium]